MKKICVLLLMLTLFFAVSCDDDDGGVQVVQGGTVEVEEPRNSWLIFHPNPQSDGSEGDLTEERDVTELEEYGKEGVRVYGKFMDALSTDNSGWAAYRWSSRHDFTDDGNNTPDATDCDGAYKVSYVERAVDNYFVGAGVCLGTFNNPSVNNYHDDARVANLRFLINQALGSGSGIDDFERANPDTNDAAVNTAIETVCDTFSTPTSIDSYVSNTDIENENGELYLFIAEVVGDTTVVPSVVSSVNVLCHPDSEIEGTDIYGVTDDSGRAYIKEAVDELYELEGDTIRDYTVIEGVWSVYTVPKLNDAGGGNYNLEPDTLNDPPKLSYFRISGNIGENNRRFIVGAGIYLDANNANEATGNELKVIRQRVRTAVGLLRGEEIAEEEELSSLFADGNAFIADGSEFILNADPVDQNDMIIDPEAYIFVWENR